MTIDTKLLANMDPRTRHPDSGREIHAFEQEACRKYTEGFDSPPARRNPPNMRGMFESFARPSDQRAPSIEGFERALESLEEALSKAHDYQAVVEVASRARGLETAISEALVTEGLYEGERWERLKAGFTRLKTRIGAAWGRLKGRFKRPPALDARVDMIEDMLRRDLVRIERLPEERRGQEWAFAYRRAMRTARGAGLDQRAFDEMITRLGMDPEASRRASREGNADRRGEEREHQRRMAALANPRPQSPPRPITPAVLSLRKAHADFFEDNVRKRIAKLMALPPEERKWRGAKEFKDAQAAALELGMSPGDWDRLLMKLDIDPFAGNLASSLWSDPE